MNRYSILLFLCIVPGCTKVKIGSEFSELKHKTVKATGESIVLDNILHDDIANIPCVKEKIEEGLSRTEAVSIALQNNPELQADFQNIGIAKADLVQAGLYTNPTINSVFRFPTRDKGPGTAQTNIESVAAFRLSDLWQVPLSKNIAQDLLEIVTLNILSKILDIVTETKIAYDACVAAELQWYNTKLLFDATRELKAEIYYRQLYGYTTDFDKDLINAQIAQLESKLQQMQSAIDTAYIHLKKLIGITPSSTSINLRDSLYQDITIAELSDLEEYALCNRPEIQISRMKIQQYKDSIALEKAKVFKVVDVGIAYKQDFDRPFRGWGPYIDIQLPFFDDNYAQVARAEFLLKQAEKEFAKEKIQICKEIRTPYRIIQALKKEVNLYIHKIIPSHEHAIDYAYMYAQTMQLNMVTAIESKIKYYQAYDHLIDKQYHLMKELAQLERAIGKNLTLFNETEKIV